MAVCTVFAGSNIISPCFWGRAYLSFQTIKPHVPLIKFRKGGLPDARSGQAVAQPSSGGSVRKGTLVRATIEDYQLPLKYRRQPLDDKEIEYINRWPRITASRDHKGIHKTGTQLRIWD